jgi:UDP-N-acetylmuramoylalanine--D-glutamate ligase
MTMSDWSGRNVLIIGAARQGLALARYLVQHNARVVVNDRRPADQMASASMALEGLPVTWALGGHPLHLLDGIDLIFVSGGVPLDLPILQEARSSGLPFSNDSQLFLEEAPCRTIGITGSAGKTTTTTLVGRMAQAAAVEAGWNAWVGGNIGQPLISQVDEMQTDDLAVIELSSFQLEQVTRPVDVGAILNITPNHLDRHGTMQAYTAAKARLLQFQDPQDTAVLGRDDHGAWQLAAQVRGQLVSFGVDQPQTGTATFVQDGHLMLLEDGQVTPLMPQARVRLRGHHNLLNVLAACATAHAAGLPVKAMQAGVEGFAGVPHRLEFVRTFAGADWYNDSIATAPERAMAAIRSFEEPLILLAGGRDKHLPWEAFAKLVHERVDHLIVFGEAAGLIMESVGKPPVGQRPYTRQRCRGLQEAVQCAASLVEPGDVVLLAPGGTSFDEFLDFEERGAWFRKWVMELS